MKKLLSLILTIAMISTILVSTTLTVGADYSNDGFSVNNETHYLEDFSTNEYNLNVTSKATTEGTAVGSNKIQHMLKLTHNTKSTLGSTGTAVTVQDPTGAERNVLKLEALDALGTRNRIDTTPNFSKQVAGIQYADIELYIPADQIDNGDLNRIYICAASNGFSTPAFYLCGSECTDTSSDKIYDFPKDAWFTVRLTFDYFANKGYASIIFDSTEKTIQTVSLTDAMKTNGLTNIYIDGTSAKKYFYIGSIHYWQKGSEASAEHFINSSYNSINVSVRDNISYWKASTKNSNGSEGGAWFMGVAGGDGYSADSASRLVLSTKDNSYRGDITIASIDMFFNGGNRFDGEKICVYAETCDYTTKTRTQYGDAINIQKDKVWYGSDSTASADAATLPLNQWFTLRIVYNHNTHYYRYELVYDDNSVKLLCSGYASLEDIASLGEYGVCGLTMTYDKVAGTKVGVDKTAYIYIDNIAVKNISLDDLSYDENSLTATVKYQAHLDTVAVGKLILAQYNTTGELISIQTATPVYTESATEATATFTKADGATKTKLMFLDDLNTVIPFATSIEK